MTELEGLVLRSQSGHVRVHTAGGVIEARVRGRLKQGRATSDLTVIGDRVRVRVDEATIEAIEPRRNRFARRQPGSRGRYKEDVLVANLDRLVIVLAAQSPPPNPRLLDRFLVLAELDGIEAVIVVNKIDQDEEQARSLFAPYEALGYAVIYACARDGRGVDALRALVHDRVCAFLGPSGVGKSSLLNALEPGLGAEVGEVSSMLDKGRHTTRVAELHPLSGGGWLADTPGIRELASFALPERELAGCFREMRPLLGACAFSDCSHVHEPRCAIRAAVERGEIRPERYDSYLRIRRGEER
ncbi:MAG: ribosome small subunit-dependent GTPase A [Sandaracinaceae bacterium]|nr:ribosome small subunit-dependent GTPase A [Sandaracinaceae bacterium]